MNELQLVEALEPYVTELLSALQRIDAVEKRASIPGDPGKDADVDEIIARLRADPVFRGRPGTGPTLDETVEALKAETAFVESLRAPAPNIADVVKELVENHAELLKGQPGKDATAPTAKEVADLILVEFGDSLKGEPGKDATAASAGEVAVALLENDTFKLLVTPVIPDNGKDARPEDVAKALLNEPEFVALVKAADPVPGDPGKDADAAEVAAVLRADAAFVASLKGEPGATPDPLPAIPGDPGKDGADGAGIHAAEHEPNKVYREGTLVMAFIGQYYKAKCDTAKSPGESDDWARVGTAGFRWRGLKPEEKSLTEGDLFIDGGSMFGYFGGKASMVVQRPKSAPVVKSISAKDGQLLLRLSDGSEVVGELPVAKGYTLIIERLEERLLVLDEALANSEANVNKLLARLEKVEKYLTERDDE